MCLASRISTQANLGNMHEFREIVKIIIGNIALVQIQAIVAAVLVSIFAITVNAIMEGSEYTFKWNNCLLLATASVCTATSTCFILGKIIIIDRRSNSYLYCIYFKFANVICRFITLRYYAIP